MDVFTGNVRIDAGDDPEFVVLFHSSADSHAKDRYRISIPSRGLKVWTESRGHQYYGAGRQYITIVIDGTERVATSTADVVVLFEDSETVLTENNMGTFKIDFSVTALDEDITISNHAALTGAGSKDGTLRYSVVNGAGDAYTPAELGNYTAELESTTDESGGRYWVDEGDTEDFTLFVTVEPSVSGKFRMQLTDVFPYIVGATSGVVSQKRINGNDFTTRSLLLEGSNTVPVDCETDRVAFGSDCGDPRVEITNITNHENPRVTGIAYNTDQVGFSVSNGDKVYGSGLIRVVNNKWEHKIRTDLKDGKYEMVVYVDNKAVAQEHFVVGDTVSTCDTRPVALGSECEPQPAEKLQVSIESETPTINEDENDAGVFRFSHNEQTRNALAVHFTFDGDARLNRDYKLSVQDRKSAIRGRYPHYRVAIPAKKDHVLVYVTPIEDERDEGSETVTLELTKDEDYEIDKSNREADIVIYDESDEGDREDEDKDETDECDANSNPNDCPDWGGVLGASINLSSFTQMASVVSSLEDLLDRVEAQL